MADTDIAQAPPRPDRDEVVGEPDFCLSLADARIVATGALLETGENVADIVEARAMSCIYPDAGLGKTFSVLAVLKEVSAERVLLQFRSRPTPRGIRQDLFNELHLEGDPPLAPRRVRASLQAEPGPQALRPGLRRSPAVQPEMLRVRPPPVGHRQRKELPRRPVRRW
ncbi:hypothetical protein ACWGKA_20660 [Streptomyces luteogriseus]